ncbi:MAG: TMEM175 family protein [Woeseiaceae bacterium]|nr:TMEM175 family protein [Woeseiaceae bacterium]
MSSIKQSELDEMPVKDGFRLRGIEMTRTETFTDAAFAFAITLLVISIDAVPTTYDELLIAVQGIPAFGLACALLFLFWYGHWSWSRRYGLEDFPSIVLSFVLVFVMLCYIFPMKYMTSIFVAWVTERRVDVGANINSIEELFNIFVIYSIGFVAMCLAVLFLNLRAWSRRAELKLDDIEEYTTRTEIGTWLILSSVGVLAILMGLFAPQHPLTVPGWAYMLLAIVMPVWGYVRGGHVQRMIEARSEEAEA